MKNTLKTIHLIQSVKGGSGKTAFALRAAVNLTLGHYKSGYNNRKGSNFAPDNPEKNEVKGNNPEKNKNYKGHKVLYIDADVHASETSKMLYKPIDLTSTYYAPALTSISESVYYFDFNLTDKDTKARHEHFLNTYMHPYLGYYSRIEEIILRADLVCAEKIIAPIVSTPSQGDIVGYNFKSEKEEGQNLIFPKVDFIFSDSSKQGRDVFGSLFQSLGKSAIGVGVYLAKIRNLLDYIMSRDYTDIIVDMPPGSDTFSNHLTEQIINFVSGKTYEYCLNVYYISTDDKNHMRSAIHAAVEHLHVMRSSSPIRNYFVYNQGRECVDTFSAYEGRKNIISGVSPNFPGLRVIFDEIGIVGKTKAEFELNRLEYLIFFRDLPYYHSPRHDNNNVFFGTVLRSDWDDYYIKKLR